MAPGFSAGLNVSGCIYCGQCVRVCPTGALMERSHVDAVVAALGDPDTVVVAQIAPAVPATLDRGARPGRGRRRRCWSVWRPPSSAIGFDAVFDTGFAADLTIMEEATELVERVQNGGVLPMFTSCSPAWVQYVETAPARPHPPPLHLQVARSRWRAR